MRRATTGRARPSASSPDLSRYVGRYRITECIGRGAVGLVYAADDESTGRRVAVKVIAADLEAEPDTRARFQREASVTGELVHANIVTVLDHGEDGGRPYLVMELLSGLPLGEYLRTPAAASLERKVDLMCQLCSGLHMAHGRGVVHRDIKPGNLFVGPDGTLKILDFGMAKLAASTITANGFPVGTPDYMSPEQVQGRAVDPRSDVFSATAVLYFMLTGRPPFAAGDLPKTLYAIVHGDPEPLTDDQAPPSLKCIVVKGLAKTPDDRYQDCQALVNDLRGLTADDEPRGRQPVAGKRVTGLLKGIQAQKGQSTTEWLMIAGILSAVAIFLVGTVPRALGVFMKAMAISVRTIAP